MRIDDKSKIVPAIPPGGKVLFLGHHSAVRQTIMQGTDIVGKWRMPRSPSWKLWDIMWIPTSDIEYTKLTEMDIGADLNSPIASTFKLP